MLGGSTCLRATGAEMDLAAGTTLLADRWGGYDPVLAAVVGVGISPEFPCWEGWKGWAGGQAGKQELLGL